MTRVLVIGSGMAGAAAALSARAAGANVTVVAAGPGSTAFATGPVWPQATTLGARFDGFTTLPAGSRVANVLGELAAPTQALHQQARGAIAAGRKVAVVGVRGAPQLLDAGWVADGLRRAGIDAAPVELSIYLTAEECRRSQFEWATALEAPAEQDRWSAGLARLSTGDQLLLPPLLGWDVAAFDRIRATLGRELGELAATTPSVPGLRLSRMLEARLRAADCAIRRDQVRSLSPEKAVLASGEILQLDRAVLASGRFLGGGLRRAPAFAEPLLGLALTMDDGPAPLPGVAIETLAGERPGAEAPAFRLGLAVDGAQHPLDAGGRSLDWLFAAGSILAGPDRGLGFAWASGTAAGRAAAGAVVGTRSGFEGAGSAVA